MENSRTGCVYMLYAENYPKVYIGSTINIQKRISNHKQLTSSCNAKALFGTGQEVKHIILHTQHVHSRRDLFEKEREYIKKYQDTCLNRNIPLRTAKEYYQDNRKHLQEYHRNKYTPKKSGGDGKYTQLQHYHTKKNEILRKLALKNALKRGTPPNPSTMKKHDITQDDYENYVKGQIKN